MADNPNQPGIDRQLEDRLASYRDRIDFPRMGDSAATARSRIESAARPPGTAPEAPGTLFDDWDDGQVAPGPAMFTRQGNDSPPTRLRRALTMAAAVLAIFVVGAALAIALPALTGSDDGSPAVLGPETTGYQLARTIGGPLIPNEPVAVAVDSTGNIYAADIATRSVHKFDASGMHLESWTAENSEVGAFIRPWALAVRGDTLYVLDQHRAAVYVLDTNGTVQESWQVEDASEEYDLIVGIAVDTHGRIYVTSANTGVVAVFERDGGHVRDIPVTSDLSSGAERPLGIAVADDGTLYVTMIGGNSVRVFDSSGQSIADWTNIELETQYSGGLFGVTVAPSGDIYVNSEAGVTRLSPDGNIRGSWSIDAGYPVTRVSPFGPVAVDAEGAIYMQDPGNQRIVKLADDGEMLLEIADDRVDRFSLPGHMAIAEDGTIHVPDAGTKQVKVFSPSGELTGTLSWEVDTIEPPRPAPMSSVALSRDHIYVLDGSEATIVKLMMDGTPVLQWSGALIEPDFWSRPRSIHIGAEGNVLLLDDDARAIYEYSAVGEFLGHWDAAARGPERENPLSMDVRGDTVYVAYGGGDLPGVWTFDLEGNLIARMVEFTRDDAGNLDHLASGLAVAPTGDIFTVDPFTRSVRWYARDGDLRSEWSLETGFDGAMTLLSIGVSDTGTLYVSDGDTRQVLVYEPVR